MIEVEFENGSSNKIRKAPYKASVGKFFDENGNLLTQKLNTELCAFFQKLAQDK
jgi:hypothetical protein